MLAVRNDNVTYLLYVNCNCIPTMPGLIGCQLRVGLVLVVAVKTVVVSTCTVPRLYMYTEEIMAPLVCSEYMYFILASLAHGWQAHGCLTPSTQDTDFRKNAC